MTSKEISGQLLKEIMAGAYSEATRLPSESALAERFGVSRMTLRVALDELRHQGLIEKRNGLGSFLTKRALRRSGGIGLVVPDFETFAFFTEIKKEIERHASRLGYRIDLVFTRRQGHAAAVRDILNKVRELAAKRIEGAIFRPFVTEDFSETNREIVNILRQAEVPVVLIDSDITRPPERSDCDLVAVNNIGAGRQIARHLHERGYRRIAFLMENRNPLANANWSNRLFGLAGELALRGGKESVRQLAFSPNDGNAVAKLLRRRTRPDAIVCGNDEQAERLMGTISRLGKRVPDDVAVVGFDDMPFARAAIPPLTTVSQPVRKLAGTAFKLLLARIRYPNNDPREILLDAPLVVRSTTGIPPVRHSSIMKPKCRQATAPCTAADM